MSSMAAISGLLVNSNHLDIISNNIANASTIGYKSIKPIFFDMFSPLYYSNNVFGYGVGISNIIQNFNNGSLFETGRDLDVGIVADGFFRVLDDQGHIHYTRNGQFLIDKNKNIINMQGMYLTGYNKSNSNKNVQSMSSLEPINFQDSYILKEKPTSEIKFKAILKNDGDSTGKIDISDNKSSNSKDYMTYINIYNKEGKKEKIDVLFHKKDKNIWRMNLKSSEDSNDSHENIQENFDLQFDSNGQLTSDKNIKIQLNNSKYNDITLNLTDTIEQSNIDSSSQEYSQDGYSQGDLKTFNILSNGEIIGVYSNEKEESIGQISLAKFMNPEKLQAESGNLWSATSESGAEKIELAGNQKFNSLNEKTLEASNVDLNQELINMIIAQRNYQSNAQSFKTEDKIINTLINLR